MLERAQVMDVDVIDVPSKVRRLDAGPAAARVAELESAVRDGIFAIVGPLALGLFVMFLEIFIAFVQAYIFAMLVAVFIGLIRHAH